MTVPFKFQLEDVRKIHKMNGRCLISWEMGLGKTLAALLHVQRHPQLRPAIVVCPATIKYTWEAEAARHVGMRAEVLEGTRPPRDHGLVRPDLIVVNYDVLGAWLPRLKALDPQIIILDEAHYLQSRTTQRTRNCRELCQDVPHILALTGTPLLARPAELWPTLNILRPDLFPSFWPFASRYCDLKRGRFGWDCRGASHLAELHETLERTIMLRRRKEDVLSQLPAKTRAVVPLELSDRKEYEEAERDFRGWLARKDPLRLRRADKALQLAKVSGLKRLAARLKLRAALNWIADFLASGDGKLVLFGVHHEILNAVYSAFRKEAVLVTGNGTGRDRQHAIEQFQHHRRTRLFVGQCRAAGVGLTLTAASTLAFLELDWTPGVHTQCEDRIHRIGTRYPVSIHYLVARGTIEHRLALLLQTKQRTTAAVLDGDGRGDDLDVFDRLMAQLAKETI